MNNPELVPEKCGECPVICGLFYEIRELEFEFAHAELQGQIMVGGDGVEVDRQIEAQVPPEYAELAKTGIRQATANWINNCEEKIADVEENIKTCTGSCEGALTMRATRDGISYIATICASRAVNDPELKQDKDMPAHIRTEFADEPKK